MLLGERADHAVAPDNRDVWLSLAICALPVLLILKQPDVGTIMVLGFVIFGVISMSGVSAKWVVGMLLVAVVGALVITHLHLLKQYQIDRLTNFTEPDQGHPGLRLQHPPGAHRDRLTAACSGRGCSTARRPTGTSCPSSRPTSSSRSRGRSSGSSAPALVVLLVGVVLWRGLTIAAKAEDAFGTLIAVGIVCWFGFQAFENIGMTRRHHAGDGAAAALRVLRRVGDVRRDARDRPAAERLHALPHLAFVDHEQSSATRRRVAS